MEATLADLRHYLGIYIDEQRKITKHVNQCSRFPSRGLITGPPEYEPVLIDCDVRSHEFFTVNCFYAFICSLSFSI
jgi:hypothetical protein